MSLWAIIVLVWKNWGLLKQIFSWIQEGITWIEIQERLKAFKAAADKAEASKDTTDLENQFKNPNDPNGNPPK